VADVKALTGTVIERSPPVEAVAKIKRDRDAGEYLVWVNAGGKNLRGTNDRAVYFTDDKDDAEATAKLMVDRFNSLTLEKQLREVERLGPKPKVRKPRTRLRRRK
jgi:hypothetical protein